MKILKCGDKLLDLRKPKVMGILNVTPDSFYDGSKYDSVDKAISQVKIMVAEKVDVLDIGAASSRPGASQLSAEEEWQRLQPVLEEIVLQFPEILTDHTNLNVLYKIARRITIPGKNGHTVAVNVRIDQFNRFIIGVNTHHA